MSDTMLCDVIQHTCPGIRQRERNGREIDVQREGGREGEAFTYLRQRNVAPQIVQLPTLPAQPPPFLHY